MLSRLSALALSTACIVVSASAAPRQPEDQSSWRLWSKSARADLSQSIQQAIDEVATAQRNIGLAAAVSYRGTLVFSGGLGFADLEHRVLVSQETRFQIASITKAFTGAVLLKLLERGQIDLDAPIQRYVPAFPVKPEGPITLRLLQAHLSGIRGYRPDERTAQFFARHYTRATDAIEIFAADPLVAPPGQKPVYSSYGYNLIAAALEGATGRPFPELVATEVIGPLKLARTRVDDARVPVPHRSRSYSYRSPQAPNEETTTLFRGRELDFSYNYGGGNILTTPEDLTVFGRSLTKPGFLNEQSLALAGTPSTINGVGGIQSFGWAHAQDSAQRRVLFTTGQIEAFQAGISVWPEHDLVVAVTSNTDGIGSRGAALGRDLTRRIGVIVLDHERKR